MSGKCLERTGAWVGVVSGLVSNLYFSGDSDSDYTKICGCGKMCGKICGKIQTLLDWNKNLCGSRY